MKLTPFFVKRLFQEAVTYRAPAPPPEPPLASTPPLALAPRLSPPIKERNPSPPLALSSAPSFVDTAGDHNFQPQLQQPNEQERGYGTPSHESSPLGLPSTPSTSANASFSTSSDSLPRPLPTTPPSHIFTRNNVTQLIPGTPLNPASSGCWASSAQLSLVQSSDDAMQPGTSSGGISTGIRFSGPPSPAEMRGGLGRECNGYLTGTAVGDGDFHGSATACGDRREGGIAGDGEEDIDLESGFAGGVGFRPKREKREGEIDYKSFLDLTLAMENCRSSQVRSFGRDRRGGENG